MQDGPFTAGYNMYPTFDIIVDTWAGGNAADGASTQCGTDYTDTAGAQPMNFNYADMINNGQPECTVTAVAYCCKPLGGATAPRRPGAAKKRTPVAHKPRSDPHKESRNRKYQKWTPLSKNAQPKA